MSVRVRTLTEEVQAAPAVTVRYRTHVQTYGWQKQVTNGTMSGTSGQAKRLEGIEIAVSGNQKLWMAALVGEWRDERNRGRGKTSGSN